MQEVLTSAKELFTYTRDLRRDIHQNPEIGFKEYRTAGIVARELEKLSLPVKTGVAKTGVIAVLEGAQPGRTVLLRFDMDALPIAEETGAPYASQNQGVMHACGHDGHIAIGLAVARLLHARRENLRGKFKFVFQPAEEGLGGAEAMVAEGVLEEPRPDVSLALHLWNIKPVGWIGVTAGPAMSASESFQLCISGKGGHGAAPHLVVDPVVASAHIVTALQTIVSRNVNPLKSAVVSVTTIHGGDAHNVVPPAVEMSGTIRTFDPEIRETVLKRFEEIVTRVAESFSCQVKVTVKRITPEVINHPDVSAQVQKLVLQLLPDCTLDTTTQTMGSEDMAYMMESISGCYFFIGSANKEKGLDAPHHHPRFDFDEEVLPTGVALMTAVALELSGSTDGK
ncbi:MAG: amidohydrolase [Chloroflexota bacterium]